MCRAAPLAESGQLLPIGRGGQASSLLSRSGILPILHRRSLWANEGSAPSEPPERSEVDLSFRPPAGSHANKGVMPPKHGSLGVFGGRSATTDPADPAVAAGRRLACPPHRPGHF